MQSGPKSYARATVLAGTLATEPPPVAGVRLSVPAVFLRLEMHAPPTDVSRFHDRVLRDGSVVVLHNPWRRCPHRR